MQLKRRDGELFWVQMGGSCVRPTDPDSGVIRTFLDINGRKKSEVDRLGPRSGGKRWTASRPRAAHVAHARPGLYDEKLVRHIFGNLLSNTIKYSPQGGRVRFELRRDGGATVFRVADQGIGIPADEIGHLFESFHRASNVGTIQGTGLGLAIVKNAVEMHRGTIAVESRLGAGTTFTVRLPAAGPARPS